MANKALDDFLNKYGDYKPAKEKSQFESDYQAKKEQDALASWKEKYGNTDLIANYNKYINSLNDYGTSLYDYAWKTYSSWDEYRADDTGSRLRSELEKLQERSNFYNNALSARKDTTYSPEQYKSVTDYLSNLSNTLDSVGNYWNQYDPYPGYSDRDDFGELSQYKSTKTTGVPTYVAGTLVDTGFGDLRYDLINGDPQAQKAWGNQYASDIMTGQKDIAAYQYVTDYERQIYNYIYATEGKESADKYFDDNIMPRLNAEDRAAQTEIWKKYADENPILANGTSLLMSPLKGLSYLGQVADVINDGKIDQNAAYNRFSYIPSTVVQETAGNIKDRIDQGNGGEKVFGDLSNDFGRLQQIANVKAGKSAFDQGGTVNQIADAAADKVLQSTWGEAGSTAYQTGMSMLEFLLNSMLTGTYLEGSLDKAGLSSDAAKKAAEIASLTVMGAGAAADTVLEAKDRGMSDGWSFAIGTVAGMAEILTEKVSIETLMQSGVDASVIATALRNAFPEGMEELGSDLINWSADAILTILTDEPTQFRIDMDEYLSQGLSESQAFARVIADRLVEGGTDFLGGTVSGGILGGIQGLQNIHYQNSIGKGINASGTVSDTLDLANGLDENSEIYRLAQQIRQKQEAGQKIPNKEIGHLEMLAQQQMREADTAIDKAASERDARDVKNVLKSLSSSEGTGSSISADTISGIRTNPFAMRELGLNASSTDAQIEEALSTRKNGSAVYRNYAVKSLEKARTSVRQAYDKGIVKSYAEEVLGKAGAATMQQMYSPESQDAMEYIPDAAQYYNRGGAGEDFEYKDGSYINEVQAKAMYEAGKIDKENGGLPNVERNNALSGSRERNDGTVAGVQNTGVAEGAGSPKVWQINRKAADSGARNVRTGAEEVTAKSLGLGYGTDDTKARLVEDNLSRKMRKAVRNGEKLGFKVILFAGDDLTFSDGKSTWKSRGLIDGDTIYIRADDSRFTADLVAGHEITHGLIARGEIDVDEVWNRLVKNISGKNVQKLLSMYIPQYSDAEGNLLISVDELKEEIVCDAVGGMNTFLGTIFAGDVASAQEWIRQSVKETKVGTTREAADSKTTKYSRAAEAAAKVGIEVDEKTESAASYSYTTWKSSEYVMNRNSAAKALAEALDVTEKEAKKYIDDVNGIAAVIADDRNRLDYVSSPGRSSFVSNTEYGGSFDFSTLCKKRRLITGTLSEIQKMLPNTALSADDILKIRNMMIALNKEVNCGLCYVEGSRANMGQFSKKFIELYEKHNPGAEWIPNMVDVNTPDGVEKMRIQHPDVYEQYEYFWNHYGTLKKEDPKLFASQQKPKLYQLRTEYKGEILDNFKKDSTVETKNANGGVRMQSFSDFEIVHLIDMMQIIMDMSRVGLAGQAYTKVPEFALALGDTGLKINLSLIAKGVDENGKLIFDDREGMPHEKAFEIRNMYSKNVGTIIVAFNDAQLLAAMNDDRIDFIIPFHRSQWKKAQYGAMGLPSGTKDYTYQQNEKFLHPDRHTHDFRGRTVRDKATNFMPNTYWDYNKSGKENAENYLRMCAEADKRPKFYKLLQNNGDGSYSLKADGSTDGYWKLLGDFKMYDNNGIGSPQMPVRPVFNMEQAEKMLREYQGGHEQFPIAGSVVDQFVKEYKDSHKGSKYSRVTDAEYLKAAEAGDIDTASRMVKEAAEKAGYAVEAYHGTREFGFTKIDTSKSDDHTSFFVTADIETAQTYSIDDTVREINDRRMTSEESEERVENALKEAESQAGSFAGYVSSYAGIQGWLDVDNFLNQLRDITPYAIEFEDRENYEERFWEIIDQITDDLYQATVISEVEDDDFDSVIDYADWLDSHENDKLHDAIDELVVAYDQYIDVALEDQNLNVGGNYHFFINPTGVMTVNGNGRHWNMIEGDGKSLPETNGGRYWTTRTLCKLAKEKGYTGVRFKDILDDGGRSTKRVRTPADVYALFNPREQVKSADPIVYDDNGNVIPLSERFNPKNEDIRYSRVTDREYYDAVYANNKKALSSMVREAALDAGAFTNGKKNPIEFYHGTPADFTFFDPEKMSAFGLYGIGHYFSDNKSVANEYSVSNGKKGNVIKAYLISNNVATMDSHMITADNVKKFLAEYDLTVGKTIGKYADSVELWLANRSDAEAIQDLLKWSRMYETGKSKTDTMDDVVNILGIDAQYQKYGNYSGYLVVYNNKTIKSADLVTYSTSGNTIPLSKRFDTNKVDIRFSRVNDNLTITVQDGHMKDTGEIVDFINLILDGKKKGETRTHKSLTRKQWLGLAKNGYVYGRVKFGDPILLEPDSQEYEDAMIKGTEYDIKPGEKRYYYPIEGIEDFRDNPRPVKQYGPLYSKYSRVTDNYAPTFYSKLEREVENYKGGKLGAASVVQYLKGRGVKDEEIKWSGINTFLEGKKSVSKDELLQHIRESMIRIEESALVANPDNPIWVNDDGDVVDITHFFNDDGEEFENQESFEKAAYEVAEEEGIPRNKVKIDAKWMEFGLLSAIDRRTGDEFYEAHTPDLFDLRDAGFEPRGDAHWEKFKTDGGYGYREILFTIPGSDYTNPSMETHWGRPGVLAHARVQSFDANSGHPALFVEEIQSDWHNAGSKRGYENEDHLSKNDLYKRYKDLHSAHGAATDTAVYNYETLMNHAGRDLPFDTTGYVRRDEMSNYDLGIIEDRYSSTIGKEHPELLDEIRGYVLSIDRARKIWEKTQNALEAYMNYGDYAQDAPFKNNYTDYVLKSLLRRAAEDGYDYLAWTTSEMQLDRWNPERKTEKQLLGDGKTSGVAFQDGYRIEYDQQIPSFLKKYGKQWGAKLTEITLDENNLTVPAIEITDEMRHSVLYEGQPRFSRVTDSNGRKLSEQQEEFFRNSQVRDPKGRLLAMYHGSAEDFNVFDKDKIRAVDYDAPFNGFWFSSDEDTDPAFEAAKYRKQVYLNITNPAPRSVWKKLDKELLETYAIREGARSINDEIRMRLQEMGYDGIHYDGAYVFDEQNVKEYNRTGSTTFSDAGGRVYDLRRSEYDDARLYPHGSNNEIMPFDSAEDFLEQNENEYRTPDVWVAFEPEQIKRTDNLTPTNDPDIRYSRVTDEEYLDAVKKEDWGTVERMVRDAAIAAGFTEELYHGTDAFGWTVPDTQKSDDKLSFFAARSPATAASYTISNEVTPIDSADMANRVAGSYVYKDLRFDTQEQLDDFKKRYPNYKTKIELDEIENNLGLDDTDGWDEYEDIGYESRKARKEYDDLDMRSTRLTTFRELVEHPERYSLNDLNRAIAAWDSNLGLMDFDDEAESKDPQEVIGDFIDWLKEYAEENEDETFDEILDSRKFYGRVPAGEKYQRTNSGIYKLYANTDGLITVNGKGNRWSKIPFVLFDDSYKKGIKPAATYTTRQIAKFAKEMGYAGVHYINVIDIGSKGRGKGADDIFVFFNPQQQVRSADPVTYDDNGNIIPLSERFNPKNEDIRYSRVTPNIDALAAENQELRKEMSKLRSKLKAKTEQASHWKKEAHVSTEPTLDEGTVKNIAKELLKNNFSKMSVSEATKKLNDICQKILTEAPDNDNWYEDVRNQAISFAAEINEQSTDLNDSREYSIQNFRKYLKDVRVYVTPSARNEIAPDGWTQFTRSLFGTMTFTNEAKGMSVDKLYNDMRADFGEWLFPDDITAEADQMNHIIDVIQSYKSAYNSDIYDAAIANEWTADEILSRVMAAFGTGELRQSGKTRADKLQERINNQREWSQQALQKVRESRDRNEQALREHYKEVNARKAERRANSNDRTRLLRIARRLHNKKLSAVNRALVDQYIGDLDLIAKGITKRSVKNLSALRDWYNERKANDPDFIPDVATENAIERLSKRHIADLTTQEVAELTNVLLNIEYTLRTEKEMVDSQVKQDVYAAGLSVISDVQQSAGPKNGFLDTYVTTQTLTPEREAHRIVGYVDDDPMYILVKELSAGQQKMDDYQIRAENMFKKWSTNKEFSQNFSGKKAETITITGVNPATGENTKVQITPAMRVGLYLSSLNADSMRHIAYGGAKFPDMTLYKQGKTAEAWSAGKSVKLLPSVVREITSHMTPEEKAFADMVHFYFNEVSRPAINETSELTKGYSVAYEDHYYPIHTDTNFLAKEFDEIKNDGSIEGMGFLKQRIHASMPVLIFDADVVLKRSIMQHAKYVGLAVPVRNFMRLWNMKQSKWQGTVQQAIDEKWGENAKKYFSKLMRDLQTSRPEPDVYARLLASLRSKYAGATLTVNASVAIKQAASYFAAAAVVGYKPLILALKDFNKVEVSKIFRYTPLYAKRARGYSTPELGELRESGKRIPKVLNWIQAMDLATTRKLWRAAEIYVSQNNKNLTGEGYNKAVAVVYNRIIEETQPNYSTMQRPQVLRSDSEITRALNMFKTQPFQNFNVLYEAVNNYRAKAQQYSAIGTEAARQTMMEARTGLVRAVSSQVLSAFVFALMQYAWDAFRGKKKKYKDDDDEETFLSWMKGMGINMLSSAGGMIPFGSFALELGESIFDIVSKLVTGEKFFDQKFYGMSDAASDALNDAGSALIRLVNKTANVIEAGDVDENYIRSLVDSATEAAGLAGVPVRNVINLFQAVARNAFLATEGEYIGGYHALRLTTDPSTYPGDYYDLLYKAYTNDAEAYAVIYAEMLKEKAFSEEKIKDNLEKRMKDAAGVKSVKDLPKRWLSPDAQARYDELSSAVDKSILISGATAEQKSALYDRLYNLAGGTDSGQSIQQKIDGGKSVGLTAAEYLLYTLALDMVDKPNDSGKLGSYTVDELEAAIRKTPGLTDAERSYLWIAAGKSEKTIPKWR